MSWHQLLKDCRHVISLCAWVSRECVLVLVAACTLGLWFPRSVVAEPAQVDLSVSLSMTPSTFVPGGHGTFTLTLHNAGPDAAGTSYPGLGSIIVIGGDFIVTHQPPPFELVVPEIGKCFIERAVTEPLPDGNIALVFIYHFGAIAAGESQSCTSGIEFYPSTQSSFSTTWSVFASQYDVDINPANDKIEHVFQLRPSAIPSSSPIVLVLLGLGLAATAWFGLGSKWTAEAKDTC